GPDIAVLRLWIHARPGGRILALAGGGRAAERPTVPARSRPHVRRRAGEHQRQPRARARAPGGGARRGHGQVADGVRGGSVRVRRLAVRAERSLAALEGTELSDAPADRGTRTLDRRRARALDRIIRLMRIDPILA